jgi:hypothetical protein
MLLNTLLAAVPGLVAIAFDQLAPNAKIPDWGGAKLLKDLSSPKEDLDTRSMFYGDRQYDIFRNRSRSGDGTLGLTAGFFQWSIWLALIPCHSRKTRSRTTWFRLLASYTLGPTVGFFQWSVWLASVPFHSRRTRSRITWFQIRMWCTQPRANTPCGSQR